MAMALPLAIPSSPHAGTASPSSTDGSNGPHTPASPSNPPTLALPPPSDNAAAAAAAAAKETVTTPTSAVPGGGSKRKPSRRANTAERRATHNAVERQRRETLNGRFLDLAALLPNLSQIRRPSKSSIVNSSIAHIHAARRHRLVAARELRLLKLEADALRRELNEWRDRSGLPRVEEPVRGEAFQMVLSGEVEVLAGPVEEDDGAEYGDGDYGDDEYVGAPGPLAEPVEEMRGPLAHAAAVALLSQKPGADAFGPGGGLHLQTMLPARHGAAPMIVSSPTSVSFENPAMAAMYDTPHAIGAPGGFFAHGGFAGADEKPAAWHGPMYPSIPSAGGAPFSPPPGTAQQQQQQQQHGAWARGQGHMFGSPADGDDASSVGSAPRRERSGSMGSTGSGYGAGSPGAGAYDLGRRGAAFGEMGMGGMGLGVGPTVMMKSASMGGGNAHGYAAMML
ncbi:hypothetical protein WOLCODRAFT_87539 [Wolfiporia cocos MD-104 SS10]|uniref:BHLH domain-containing protein n=1 Tax=Wolfiporia cocos (strain MD-104) TaxID=742152 RepID=A0A2H3J622_WOLCO|nr:hypothetical protein WOLCODRAFT_87539 [Wolfiporia cocos MD-104 SS10]